MIFRLLPTFRNLLRNPLYSVLNLSGLAIGMAAAMLIALWVQNELRFDRYHHHAAQIWRVETDHKVKEGETLHFGGSSLKTTELCEKIPGIAQCAQLLQLQEYKTVVRLGPELFSVDKMAYIGADWLEVFNYAFVEGSAAGFGERPNDMILTESLARKIFGQHHALGNILRIDTTDFAVHAVIRDPRPESSFRQQMLLPIEAHLGQGDTRKKEDSWNYSRYTTFVQLREDARPEAIAAQLTQEYQTIKQDSTLAIQLSPLAGLHFDTSIKNDIFDKGSRSLVWTFALIGMLILGMAAVNYISLTTARAQTRAREVGIRKLVGARKSNLFGQFLKETWLLASFAGLLAVGIVQSALPWFNALAGNTFLLPWNTPLPWLLMGGVVVSTVLLSGIYPALLMAGFKPMMVLRGQGRSSGTRSIFRQSLVVVQFAVSVVLLICTVVVGRQRAFIQNKDMGYQRAQIFTFSIDLTQLDEGHTQTCFDALEQTLGQSSAIAGVSRASESPVHVERKYYGAFKFDGRPEGDKQMFSQLNADVPFGQLFGIQMAEGRWFEQDNNSDFHNVILNETAAKQLDIPKPWLGQHFRFEGWEWYVIGLVRDVHFLPLQEAITPLVIFNKYDWRGCFFVKTQPGQSTQALAAAKSAWKQWFPERPFEYSFLDEDFNKLYRAEQRAVLLFNLFAGIAIFLSCLGLFGLATFMAAQRIKEIGIR
ncbi:MAG: ABC transporter permease, partial [Saprospiraceae bacterium]|nr:ABC transporter permease [Saprospiraceae bacterium]